MLTISVDTGGTFTDGFFQRGEAAVSVKVDTTPHDPVLCLKNCLVAGASELDLTLAELLTEATSLRYATTLSTNAIIQRRGTRVGLIVSDGAERLGKDDPLRAMLAADMVEPLPVVGSNGSAEVDEGALVDVMRELLQRGARGIVIALDNAWEQPDLERRARALIKGQFPRHYLGAVPIILSSDVTAGGPVEAARNAAVANAYIHQIMAQYLYRAARELRAEGLRSPLLVVHSSGGVARVAKTLAINTYGSGPAAGLFAGAHFARDRGHGPLALLDVGGTSSDIAVTTGATPAPSAPARVEGVEVSLPMIHVNSIGGGGGSIIRADGSDVTVGPDSAGASPGPACYGLGGSDPTVTDANVVLGLIDPTYFLGGRRQLDPDRARRAVGKVAEALSVSVEEAAAAARRTVDATMAAGIRKELGASVGFPRLSLLAFGGGGGLHAASVATALGIRRILVPNHASILSAYGGSLMEVRHVYERWVTDSDGASEAHAELLDTAQLDMRGEGFDPQDVTIELSIAASDGSSRAIEGPEDVEESGVLRLVASGPVPREEIRAADEAPQEATPHGAREIYWPATEEPIESRIFRVNELTPGAYVHGPAVVEAPQTTIAVPAGFQLRMDGFGDLVLTESSEQGE